MDNKGAAIGTAAIVILVLLAFAYFIFFWSSSNAPVTFSNVSVEMQYSGPICFGSSIYYPSWAVQRGQVVQYKFNLTSSCNGTQTISNIYVGDNFAYKLSQPRTPYQVFKGNKIPVVLNITIPGTVDNNSVLHIYVNAT